MVTQKSCEDIVNWCDTRVMDFIQGLAFGSTFIKIHHALITPIYNIFTLFLGNQCNIRLLFSLKTDVKRKKIKVMRLIFLYEKYGLWIKSVNYVASFYARIQFLQLSSERVVHNSWWLNHNSWIFHIPLPGWTYKLAINLKTHIFNQKFDFRSK